MDIIKKYCVTINPCTNTKIQYSRGWKDYGVLTLKQQRDQLKKIIKHCLRMSAISHMDLTFEITKKGNYHTHGTISCSLAQISDFRKRVYDFLGHPSGREKYIDLCCLVKEQFTDDDKWFEYMTKESKQIYRLIGKNYQYVDNHLQGIEDIYMVE